ncbi:MAG TPA: hypothetical protein VFM64_05150 [Candidatus Nitrosotenuis sp.]|nr:hypothetical protein [Candidatus Nitrosotenuis sp.]
MKKSMVFGGIVVAIITVLAAMILLPSEKGPNREVFHARLADPKMYVDGVFSDTLSIKKGTYQFRFVPNGDSPETLSITLNGEKFHFSEDFKLEGTPHNTGISEYYTWEYLGQNSIELIEDQELQIQIDPHGNTLGPVSVYLIEKVA